MKSKKPLAEIMIQLDLPNEVPSSAPVAGALLLTNTGSDPVTLVTPLFNAALNLVVFDHLWNLVSPQPVGKVHIAHEQLNLQPGQSLRVALPDLAYTSGTAQMTFRLSKGRYYIVAVYHPGTEKLPERSVYPLTVTSNVVRLTVK
jgi:hypothetical protein